MNQYTKWAVINKSLNSDKNLLKKSLSEEIKKLKEEGYYIVDNTTTKPTEEI